MKSPWIVYLACAVVAVVVLSVTIGLVAPGGTGGDGDRANASSTTSMSAPSDAPANPEASADEPEENADLAPLDAKGTWPGRPATTTASGPKVDWCPAVETEGAAEAERLFGADATDDAACAAVRFMFEQRYSRLALPRETYSAKDFDIVLPALTAATAQTYRPRIDRFVADPDAPGVRDDLGVVLLEGGEAGGADHALAGEGRVFYGPALTTRGYRQRAVWVNPTWSAVSIDVDRSRSEPRIVATLEASAAVPVFDPNDRTDDMMTVPTSATLLLRQEGSEWRVSGWTTMRTGTYRFGALEVR